MLIYDDPVELGVGDVAALARGCTLLGSGGGGSVSAAELLLRHVLAERGPLQVVCPEKLPADARIACVGAVGSSTVMLERLPSGSEFVAAVRALERHLGAAFDALLPLEIGGVNGLLGPVAAASSGLPLLDGDAMGRAYPRLDQTVMMRAVPASPCALADPSGNLLLLDSVPDDSVERIVRTVLPALGTWAAVCFHSGTAEQYAAAALRGSISRAVRMGGMVGAAGTVLFEGTVIEVRRSRSVGEIGGVASIRHALEDQRTLRLDFANEYIAAFDDGVPVVTAPDIVGVLDARTQTPISVERLSRQQRVRVTRIPAPPALHRRPDLGLAAYGLAPVT